MARRAPALVLFLALWVAACGAQTEVAGPRVAADAGMAKGPATAPVTIVEFSDYQ